MGLWAEVGQQPACTCSGASELANLWILLLLAYSRQRLLDLMQARDVRTCVAGSCLCPCVRATCSAVHIFGIFAATFPFVE
jgi:hypothetical protein